MKVESILQTQVLFDTNEREKKLEKPIPLCLHTRTHIHLYLHKNSIWAGLALIAPVISFTKYYRGLNSAVGLTLFKRTLPPRTQSPLGRSITVLWFYIVVLLFVVVNHFDSYFASEKLIKIFK